MDIKQYPTGVRPSGGKIQIRFKQSGDSKYTHETLELRNTPANIKKAGELRKRKSRARNKHQDLSLKS